MSQNGFDIIGVSSKGQALLDVQNDEGIPVVEVEMTRTISPVKDLKSLWNFYRLCRKEKPLIVHSHTPKAGIVGMLGAKLARVPIRLHTVAGLPLMEATGIKRKVLDMVEKVTYRYATNIYPNSKGLHDFILVQRFTSEEKVKVIANGSTNGIDTSFFSPDRVPEEQKNRLKQELSIRDNDVVFVFVGRLVGDKGINELIAAFRRLCNLSPGTLSRRPRLLLVGRVETKLDPLKPETLREIEVNPDIISVGFREDVRPYFAISNALVFPSYREGFPNVVMQAGAMGLPSIVTDINGCNEIIIKGENGLIIPPKNEQALHDKMRWFLENPEEVNRMASNARACIASRYEQRVVWQALLEEYRRVIAMQK